MLYRVQEIQTCLLPPDNVKPAIIGEAAITNARPVSMEELGYAHCGHKKAVEVRLVGNLLLYCVGTLETFAEPWEPNVTTPT